MEGLCNYGLEKPLSAQSLIWFSEDLGDNPERRQIMEIWLSIKSSEFFGNSIGALWYFGLRTIQMKLSFAVIMDISEIEMNNILWLRREQHW